MRVKKASLNVLVNVVTILIGFLPAFIVRKAFLDHLGTEALGLVSLYTNLIGVFTIVELGIGSAIIYALYKPFADGNREKIKGYLNYYGRFYRIIGVIIFTIGLICLPTLDMFIKNEIPMGEARLYFVLFLLDTLIGYLFSYKLCMFIVAQDGYKISIAMTTSKLIVSLLQLAMLSIYPSFLLFICIQIIINLSYFIFMNIYIGRTFQWLKHTKGAINEEEKKSLFKNIKALFMHKVGGTLVFSIDNLIISAFINLTVVGIYNSYYMVIGAAQALVSNAMNGITASIGNLLTGTQPDYAYVVHKRLFFVSFWVSSFIVISLFNTLDQFIHLWLGGDHSLDRLTLSIVLINVYFLLMRGSVERFKEGAGIYHQDRYAPFAEAAINLTFSIILVKLIGLPGVFLGTLISNLSILFWIKPKLVYNIVFKKRLIDYFVLYLKYLFIALIPLAVTIVAMETISFEGKLLSFIVNVLLNIVIINGIYFLIFRKNEEFQYFAGLVKRFYSKLFYAVKRFV